MGKLEPAAARSLRRILLLTVVIALLVHGLVLVSKTYSHPSHSPLWVLKLGGLPLPRPAFVLAEGYPLEQGAYGSDGQQYLYVAHDLFVRRGDMISAIDYPRYRYGRVLLPALTWLASAGHSPLMPYVILAANLLFAAGIAVLLAVLVRKAGGHPAWGIILACTGSLACATDIGNIELCAQFFGLMGIWFMTREKRPWALLAFALAGLARETYLLVPLGYAGADLLARRWRAVAAWALPALPQIAWTVYLHIILPPDPRGGGLVNIVPPFFGVGEHLLEFVRRPVVTGSTVITTAVGLPLLVIIVRQILALRHDRSGLMLATAFFGVLGLCSGWPVWIRAGGFARGLDFLYPGAVLTSLRRGDRVTALLATSTLLHTANILADHIVLWAKT